MTEQEKTMFGATKIPYAVMKAARDQLEAALKAASATVAAFPHDGPMGLTPDHVRVMPEYRAALRASQEAFISLRTFNARFLRDYRAEIKAERNARKP